MGEVPVIETAYNTLLFTANAIPAAASQVYKEQLFLQYKQPVDTNYLNLVLSVFQFFLILLVSPCVMVLLGFGANSDNAPWYTLFPSSSFRKNFMMGIQCYLGTLTQDQEQDAFVEESKCHLSGLLTVLHVTSIVVVGVAVDKIVVAGATRVLYRGISAGIIVAVIGMFIRSLEDKAFNHGPLVDSLYFACTLLLIVGSEVYHRLSLEDAVFETEYPPAPRIYHEE